jgi:hypothetical protein
VKVATKDWHKTRQRQSHPQTIFIQTRVMCQTEL